jgi:hypothetical protein
MPHAPHIERHFTGSATVRDIVMGHFTGASPVRSSVQTVLIGGLAATVAFLIARAISSVECGGTSLLEVDSGLTETRATMRVLQSSGAGRRRPFPPRHQRSVPKR